MENLDLVIIDCFQLFKSYGQIIKESTIKKNYGENIFNINIMMKLDNHIFFINSNREYSDLNAIINFNNDCNFIINKLNNKYFIHHKIILSIKPLNIEYFNIINIYFQSFNNLSPSHYFLLKLYNYIISTTNINPGLKYYQSDDIFMSYNPK